MKSFISGTQAWFERWHVAVLTGIGATVLTILVSQALAVREAAQFDWLMQAGARRVRTELQAGLKARMHALSILAREQDRLFLMRQGWESDVRLILSQSPGLESITWVKPDGEQSWAYPPETAVPAALDLASLPAKGYARRLPIVIGPVKAPDGEPRLQILAPLLNDAVHQGWLLATYRSRKLLADVLANLDEYAVTVAAGDTILFQAESAESDRLSGQSRQTNLKLPGGVTLHIAVEPSGEILEAVPSFLPHVALAGGLALSLLLTLALGLRNIASGRARALEVEIAEHQRAEEEIRRLNAELEERVRRRTAELTRSNEDLKQFASFLSHELRQPLGTQVIWAELLEAQYAHALGEEGRGYVANIRSCAMRVSELISAQLALSAAAQAAAEREPMDLEAVVRSAVDDLGLDLDAVGAKVRVGPLPALLGDSLQIYQLFRNLLENAIKYRRPETPIEISIFQRVDTAAAAGDALEIVVEDNGRGFTEDEAERIFAPLERLGAEDADGQGLGLALCKTIVERHGGRLSAQGRPGEGASFRIAFPRDRLA